MSRTTRYIFSTTCNTPSGCIASTTAQPLVGLIPTSMVVTLDSAPPTNFTTNLRVSGPTGNGSIMLTVTIAPGSTNGSTTGTVSMPADATGYSFRFTTNGTITPPVTRTGHIDVTWSDAPAVYCEYGTQSNPDAAIYTVITSELIDIVAAIMGWGALVVLALQVIVGAPLLVISCANPPPAEPTWTADDFIGSTPIPTLSGVDKLMQLLAVGVWHFYCRCTPAPPGQLVPVDYPTVVDLPSQLEQPQAAPICSNTDLCASVTTIKLMMTTLAQQTSGLRQDVAWLMSHVLTQAPPPGWTPMTAYSKGTVHGGLSGTGAFGISGVDGFEVQIINPGPSPRALEGNPPYQWNGGWLSVNNADGMLAEKRITQLSFVWLPDGVRLGTSVGFYCPPGVIITVTELHRA